MKLPIRMQQFLLTDDYEGFEFMARVNPPWGEFIDAIEAIERADQKNLQEVLDRLYDLVALLIVGWNFVDDKGAAIPVTLKGFRKVPLDLLQLIIMRTRGAIEKLPLTSSEASLGQSAQEMATRMNTSRLKSAARSAKSQVK